MYNIVIDEFFEKKVLQTIYIVNNWAKSKEYAIEIKKWL
jgi:hypothetical protein